MLRVTFLLIALGSIANAQSAWADSTRTSCALVDSQKQGPAVQAFQSSYYGVLSRGKAENVAVVLYVPKNKYGCCAFTAEPNQSGITPIGFELPSRDGLTVSFRRKHYRQQAE